MFVSSAELSSRSHIPEWLLRALGSVLEQPGAGRASGEPWPKVEHVLHPWPCTDLHTLQNHLGKGKIQEHFTGKKSL